jgi:hypothetical protein
MTKEMADWCVDTENRFKKWFKRVTCKHAWESIPSTESRLQKRWCKKCGSQQSRISHYDTKEWTKWGGYNY